MNNLSRPFVLFAFCIACATAVAWAVGQSSAITLQFPPGARATGMGEAFVAVADDANAPFFNPAGLGQAPLADSWKAYTFEKNTRFTAIATKLKVDFGAKERIWVGTSKGIIRFNGRAWETSDACLLEQGEGLRKVAEKYLKVEDEDVMRRAVQLLRSENRIGMKHYAAARALLSAALTDSTRKGSIDSLAWNVSGLPRDERGAADIRKTIGCCVDSAALPRLCDDLERVFATKDVEVEDLVELRVPFTIAVAESVTAMIIDDADRFWAGTLHGLWRFDGTVWNRYTTADGLPSDFITALAVADNGGLLAGTDRGCARLESSAWKSVALAGDTSRPVAVRALAAGRGSTLYIGTDDGLWQRNDSVWTHFDTATGLLSQRVTALLFERDGGRLWVGGNNGVAIYDEKSWKRYKFPESVVYALCETRDDRVWIGTNKGAVKYSRGKTETAQDGTVVEHAPEWKTYHAKNALVGNEVYAIAVHGNDVWLASDRALNQLDYAERQLMVFYELLLPAFNLKDLWHMYMALIWPTEDWGTFGGAVNFINFGTNEYYDEFGRVRGKARAWESVFILSYGLQVLESFSLGMNVKYVYSALAPGIGEGNQGIGQTFAIDAAVLKRDLLPRFDMGLHLQTMGPPIYYTRYENADPIPFIAKLGMAYRPLQTPVHDLKLVLDFNREIVKNYYDRRPDPFYTAIYTDLINDTSMSWRDELAEVNVSLGLEYWYVNFLALRSGFLYDEAGERYELTLGLGLRYGNINFDWSYIHSPEGFLKGVFGQSGATGARHGQQRLSFIFRF